MSQEARSCTSPTRTRRVAEPGDGTAAAAPSSAEQRRHERRERQAGLSERYFYESFATREELLTVLCDEITAEAFTALRAAVANAGPDLHDQARAGVRAYLHSVAGDRRRGRVHLMEVLHASPVVEAARRATLRRLAAEITTALCLAGAADPPRDLDLDLLALGLIGAGNELLADWLLTDDPPPLDSVVEHTLVFYDQVIGLLTHG